VEALAHFQTNYDLYSLVLTDVRMAGMRCLELAIHTLRLKLEIKIVLMTAYELEPRDLVLDLAAIKYEDVVRKPFKLTQVCSAVNKQLAVR
jgi:CheY-like chemotaxis protein